MNRPAPLVLALLLGGCSTGGLTLAQGGMRVPSTSFASGHSASYTCRRYDPVTGALTDEVTVQDNIAPDQATVAALGAAVDGLLARLAAGAATGGAAARGPSAPAEPLTAIACLGEHAPGVPAPEAPTPGLRAAPAAQEAPNDTNPHPDASTVRDVLYAPWRRS